jgi:hypothetical protein
LHDVHGQCPCGEGLIVAPSPVAILGKGFVIALFGGLIVALLNKCGLLSILAVLTLGTVHTVFGILTVLALGNVHAISRVLTVPNLGVFTLLVITWPDMAVVASCKWQHEHLIVAWKLLGSSLTFVVLLSLLLTMHQ